MASRNDIGQGGDNTISPLKELYNNDSPSFYMYPLDLGDNGDPYLVFRRVKYERKKRLDLSKRKLLTSIFLPIPANLGVQYGVNYSNVDLGVVGKAISEANFDAGIFDKIAGSYRFVEDVLGPRMLRNAIQSIGDTTGTSLREGVELNVGKALNSHLAALFENVGFRSHEFTYKLIAKNENESKEIRNIIQILKYAMHPALSSQGNVFEYPDEWYIHFRKGYRENLYDFAPCVLTNFNVQYNGSNVPVFFEDTLAPVDIDITLQFQEVEILTKDKIEKEYSNRGAFGGVTGETLRETLNNRSTTGVL